MLPAGVSCSTALRQRVNDGALGPEPARVRRLRRVSAHGGRASAGRREPRRCPAAARGVAVLGVAAQALALTLTLIWILNPNSNPYSHYNPYSNSNPKLTTNPNPNPYPKPNPNPALGAGLQGWAVQEGNGPLYQLFCVRSGYQCMRVRGLLLKQIVALGREWSSHGSAARGHHRSSQHICDGGRHYHAGAQRSECHPHPRRLLAACKHAGACTTCLSLQRSLQVEQCLTHCQGSLSAEEQHIQLYGTCRLQPLALV